MSIPENDNKLWKGFNGHGLYAQRTERDRDSVIIDEAYARKSELHQLENAVSESTDTELTPNAAKDAIDAIIKAPTPGNEGTMLSYGISQNAMAWDAWESEDMYVPPEPTPDCLLLLNCDEFDDNDAVLPNYLRGTVTKNILNKTTLDYNYTIEPFPLNSSYPKFKLNYGIGNAFQVTVNSYDYISLEYYFYRTSSHVQHPELIYGKNRICFSSEGYYGIFFVWYDENGNRRTYQGSNYGGWFHCLIELDIANGNLYPYINGNCIKSGCKVASNQTNLGVIMNSANSYFGNGMALTHLSLWSKRLSGGNSTFSVSDLYRDWGIASQT